MRSRSGLPAPNPCQGCEHSHPLTSPLINVQQRLNREAESSSATPSTLASLANLKPAPHPTTIRPTANGAGLEQIIPPEPETG